MPTRNKVFQGGEEMLNKYKNQLERVKNFTGQILENWITKTNNEL